MAKRRWDEAVKTALLAHSQSYRFHNYVYLYGAKGIYLGSEAQIKELLAKFKEQRTQYLEAEEVRRQENLTFKLRIINQLKELVEDIDNINLHFSKFQQLQQDFKNMNLKELRQYAEQQRRKTGR